MPGIYQVVNNCPFSYGSHSGTAGDRGVGTEEGDSGGGGRKPGPASHSQLPSHSFPLLSIQPHFASKERGEGRTEWCWGL